MKRICVMLVICCLLGACNQTPGSRAFEKFKKQIPRLKLPYKKNCSDTVAHLKLNIPDSILKKYAPKGVSGIIGMLEDTDFYTAIVYSVSGDIEYPIIQTYNPEGDTLNNIGILAGNCCGSDSNCSGAFWGEIFPDHSIFVHDSERTYLNDENGKKSSTKFNTINTSEMYSITKDGYIRSKSSVDSASKS